MSNERKMKVGDIAYVWGVNTSKIYKCKIIDIAPPNARTLFPYTCDSMCVVDRFGQFIAEDSGEFSCSESAIWPTAEEAYNCELAVELRQYHEKFDTFASEINNIRDLLEFPVKYNLTSTNRDDVAYHVYKSKAKELFGVEIL